MAKASLELFRFALVSQVPPWWALEITAFPLILCTFTEALILQYGIAGLNLLHHPTSSLVYENLLPAGDVILWLPICLHCDKFDCIVSLKKLNW